MLIQEKTHVAIFLLLSVRAFSRSHACHESIQMSSRLSNQIAAGRGGAIAWFAEFFFSRSPGASSRSCCNSGNNCTSILSSFFRKLYNVLKEAKV